MFIEIERYVKFITKHKLTQAQMLFLYLLHRKRYDLLKEYMSTFPSEDGTAIGKHSRDELLERGFIIKINERESATSYQIGNSFKSIFIDKFEAAKEIKELYPAFAINNGKTYPLVLVDVYEIANIYGERIGYEIAEHEEVKKDLKYGLDNNLIKCGVDKFIRSEFWKPLRALREQTAVIIETDENDM